MTTGSKAIQEQLAAYRLQKLREQEASVRRQRIRNLVWSVPNWIWSAMPDLGNIGRTKSSSSNSDYHGDSSDIEPSDSDYDKEGQKVTHRIVRKPVHMESEDSANEDSVSIKYTRLDFITIGIKCLMWLFLFKVFMIFEFGAVFFVFSAFLFIWYNMRSEPKKQGEVSAYSVFNPNCEAIGGTFTAEQFEKQLLMKM
ncbi:SAYSVFN motif domain containing 1 [Oratosquilla oratoria]|uniref:SAYSVFN motif domain containing 1 n=1 Tax=Oratosquilla oratoria TaxID=337810 RepID=UPI003F76E7C4